MTSFALAVLALLAGPAVVYGQTCTPPHPFDHASAIRGSASFAAGARATCDVVAALDAANDVTAGAFVWYSLPYAVPVWRISFRIDATGFPDAGQLSAVDILAASSRHPWPAGVGPSTLLRLDLFRLPSLGPLPALSAFYACNTSDCTSAGFTGSTVVATDIANGDLFRFELATGAGDAGELRWWRNADFSDPPTGTSGPLDNAAWAGVQHVALGAFQPYYLVAQVGGTVRFADIDSPYDTLFWSDFDD